MPVSIVLTTLPLFGRGLLAAGPPAAPWVTGWPDGAGAAIAEAEKAVNASRAVRDRMNVSLSDLGKLQLSILLGLGEPCPTRNESRARTGLSGVSRTKCISK